MARGSQRGGVPVPATPKTATPEVDTELRRAIGTKLLLLFIIGDILGGGIYALVGEVGAETGGAIWSAFALALVAALFTAGSYAELVSKYPHAGGAGLFAHRAFGLPFVSFLVAFAVVASGITSASTLARGFGGDYLKEFVDVEVAVAAIVLLGLVALVNFRGISESVKLNVGFTVVELAGLILIVIIAAVALGQGDVDSSRPFEWKDGSSIFAVTLAGAALAFYALIGFEDSVNVAEETKDPTRVYPKVLFGGLAVAGVVYLLVTIGASMVVPTGDLAASDGPLLEVVKQGPLGVPEKLFSAIGLLALSNGALINMIMASRLLYGMSREKVVPGFLGRVHPGRRTPWIAILFTTAIAVVLVLTADLEKLADTTVALLVCAFAAVHVSCLVLKRDEPNPEHFRVPWIVPVIGVGISGALLTQVEGETWGRVAILMGLGIVLWGVNALLLRGESKPSG
jgi:basic amino acid/polyamine antiporter, APA family